MELCSKLYLFLYDNGPSALSFNRNREAINMEVNIIMYKNSGIPHTWLKIKL